MLNQGSSSTAGLARRAVCVMVIIFLPLDRSGLISVDIRPDRNEVRPVTFRRNSR